MKIQKVEINDSVMEYIKFWTWKKVFVVIPWLSLKSVLLNPDFVTSAFSKYIDDFTVYLFDRLKVVPEGYSIYDMADDTYNAMSKVWISSCNIFWASQWWMIAQCITVNHPDFVEKLVLWSTASKVESSAVKIFSERIELAKQNRILELIKSFVNIVYCDETIKQFWEMIINSNVDASAEEVRKFIILTNSLLNFDIDDKLWNITTRSYVLWSKNDKIFREEQFINLSEKLHSDLYLYDDFWHWVYDEAPNFRDRVFDFLKS